MNLIEDILKNGRKDTWANYAEKYDIRPGKPKKIRAKAANDIWRSYLRSLSAEELFKPTERYVNEYMEDGMYVAFGCMHLPFCNYRLKDAFLKFLSDYKLKGFFPLGDLVDIYSASRYSSGQVTFKGLDLDLEYYQSNKILDEIDDAVSTEVKEYCFGNHEVRIARAKKDIDMSKWGNAILPLEDALRLEERGYMYDEDYQNSEIKVGDVYLFHGHWCNMHVAHKYVKELKKNVIFVHTHRQGVWKEGEFEGHNIGWMGEVNHAVFDYMSKHQRDKWRNGFAVIHVIDGKSHVIQIDWKDNKFIFNGKIYSG